MSRQGFRFVHATCLCLDEHLTGTGALSAEDRQLAEDATFRAWDGIVETCIGAQVEFLLLTGNSFNTKTNSLRARVALEKGFEKLAAQHISVFVVPGTLDPATGWKKNVHLPPNVTLLGEDDQEPVAVMRDQRVMASIFVVATPNSDETRWSDAGPAALSRHQTPFRIGLVAAGTPLHWSNGQPLPAAAPGNSSAAATLVQAAIDHHTNYIALGDGLPRTEYFKGGIAHDPGCAQALSRQVTGSRGCTVINVDSDGDVTLDSVAVAPIRWEEIPVSIESHNNQNDLTERMALAMMELTPDNDERLWIVTWRLSGSGPLFDSLSAGPAQQELWKKLESELTGEKQVRRLHRLERSVDRPMPATPQKVGETRLLQDFQAILHESGDALLDQVRRELLELDWMKHHDARAIREVLNQLSRPGVFRRTQAVAAHWLE
ncbi:metallophosphoesterase family protein [Planctomicrobium piriforme]|uniref:DNA repair exonuclease SbcCD nuclease subunit n=1 Tax=Planctomicrobium piriforme TaxID=1576369 RepID=A0A1I3HQ92_9PLAN|nr:hypothetical protein [Planctomicrobium piriforme]SFI37948.1 DNA repair exonuclease SbcCD nuclease subunit [Planctomicrobium piriforme]